MQFSAIFTKTIDENFMKIPYGLLVIKNTDLSNNFNVVNLLDSEGTFTDIPHNRNIYLYCEEININKSTLVDYFLKFHLRAIVRVVKKDFFSKKKGDFFISHDSRDKATVAKPIYKELTKRGYKVWYDEYSLSIGDSLTESIEKGISECKFAILILSKNFLSNERWAKYELQSIKTRQIIKNEKTLLPVWHDINESDLGENFWLLDKLGGNTNKGIKKLVTQLEKLIKQY